LMPFPPIQFCSFDCRSEEITAAEYIGVRNLPLLGYGVAPVDCAVRARNPVVWFSDVAAGCQWREGKIERSAIFRAQRANRGSSPYGKRAYSLKPLPGLSRTRNVRHVEAILNAITAGMRPRRLVLCPGRLIPSESGFGKEAVHSLCHAWHERTPLAALTRSLERWSRQIASSMPVFALLRTMASDRETRDHSTFTEEAGDIMLSCSIESVNCAKSRSLRGEGYWGLHNVLLNRLGALGMGMDIIVPPSLTIALRARGLDSSVSALLSESGPALRESDLSDLIYLARSGSPTFRQLAAIALRTSASDAAVSALGQLLYDSDAWVSDCALYSLASRQEGRAWLLRVYDHVPDIRFGAPDSLRPQILWTLAGSPSDQVRALLASELCEDQRPDSAAIRAAAANGLFEQFAVEADEIFDSASRSGPLETRKLARYYLKRIRASANEGAESTPRALR
jgi:hypothetical protein